VENLNANEIIKLRELLAKEAIRELALKYCRAADRHDANAMRDLYHDDALDDHGSYFSGLAMDFIDRLPEIQAPMTILHHNVTTHNIVLDSDNKNYAEGEVYILAMHQAETENGLIDFMIGGRYLDKYQQRNGVWKFAHRTILADWCKLVTPSNITLDDNIIAGALIGKPGTQDPSYDFLHLFKRGEA
jgi:hypothetical protein